MVGHSLPRWVKLSAQLLLLGCVVCYMRYDPATGGEIPSSSVLLSEKEFTEVLGGRKGSAKAGSWESLVSKRRTAEAQQVIPWANIYSYIVNNTIKVCGPYLAPANPLVVGNVTTTGTMPQILLATLDGSCLTTTGTFTASGTVNYPAGSLSGVLVTSTSGIVFQNVLTTSYPVFVSTLTLNPNSFIVANLSSAYTFNPKMVLRTDLLVVTSPTSCVVGSPVAVTVSGCPTNNPSYSCSVTVIETTYGTNPLTSIQVCLFSLYVVGPQSSMSSTYVNMWTSMSCLTASQSTFLSQVSADTGLSAQSLNVQGWFCGSLVVVINCFGTSVTAANANCLLVYTTAISAIGKSKWGVIFATLTTTPYSSYYYYPNGSSSNPALLGLLALLAIPVGILVGIVVYCCVYTREECCEPTVCVDPMPPVSGCFDVCAFPGQSIDTPFKMPLTSSPMEMMTTPTAMSMVPPVQPAMDPSNSYVTTML